MKTKGQKKINLLRQQNVTKATCCLKTYQMTAKGSKNDKSTLNLISLQLDMGLIFLHRTANIWCKISPKYSENLDILLT